MASRIRINFHSESEAKINKQINMELHASEVYLDMVSIFWIPNQIILILLLWSLQFPIDYDAGATIGILSYGFCYLSQGKSKSGFHFVSSAEPVKPVIMRPLYGNKWYTQGPR